MFGYRQKLRKKITGLEDTGKLAKNPDNFSRILPEHLEVNNKLFHLSISNKIGQIVFNAQYNIVDSLAIGNDQQINNLALYVEDCIQQVHYKETW